PTPVWLGGEPPALDAFPSPPCLVIDTETRHLPPEEAAARMRRFALPGVAAVYKKTDSTLRGNIAAEFRALLDAWPGRRLVYVPAYPDMGRTVVDGELLVNGQPLAETAFARDPLNPATTGNIPALLAGCGVSVTVVRPAQLAAALQRAGILVCDGSRNEDLAAAAEALRAAKVDALAAGPGAFAGHWVRAILPQHAAAPARPRIGRCLVVNGSRHPASREQVRWAKEQGWQVVVWRGSETTLADLGPWTVLTTPDELLDSPSAVARELARAVSQASFDALVVFGGDTLHAICAELRIEVVTACEELLPGVPLARAGDLTLMSKAGGFGAADLAGVIRELLERCT
ncbi:MAG: hypothetical protein LLG20_18980, partial [Acidobacteriales bacterium]|nr:hypothetical protein [Terriglobales bacterium]